MLRSGGGYRGASARPRAPTTTHKTLGTRWWWCRIPRTRECWSGGCGLRGRESERLILCSRYCVSWNMWARLCVLVARWCLLTYTSKNATAWGKVQTHKKEAQKQTLRRAWVASVILKAKCLTSISLQGSRWAFVGLADTGGAPPTHARPGK